MDGSRPGERIAHATRYSYADPTSHAHLPLQLLSHVSDHLLHGRCQSLPGVWSVEDICHANSPISKRKGTANRRCPKITQKSIRSRSWQPIVLHDQEPRN